MLNVLFADAARELRSPDRAQHAHVLVAAAVVGAVGRGARGAG